MSIKSEVKNLPGTCAAKKWGGFTLVEVVIVMVITSIIVLPIGGLLNSVSRNLWSKHRNYQVAMDVDLIMERIAFCFEQTQDPTDLIELNEHEAIIRGTDGILVGFAADGQGSLNMSVEGVFRETLLRRVKQFNLRYYDGDGNEAVDPQKIKMVKIELQVDLGKGANRAVIARQRLINLWMLNSRALDKRKI